MCAGLSLKIGRLLRIMNSFTIIENIEADLLKNIFLTKAYDAQLLYCIIYRSDFKFNVDIL